MIPFKQWLMERADAFGVKPHAIYMRMKRGYQKWPKLKKLNSRVWFVVT